MRRSTFGTVEHLNRMRAHWGKMLLNPNPSFSNVLKRPLVPGTALGLLICSIPPCLRVCARVPVGVKDDDTVRTGKVHTQSAHLVAAKEQ
jgi:hypothetical protein